MMRAWIGVALLAVSWLLGMRYYYPPNYLAWVAVVVAGSLLLFERMTRMPGWRERPVTLALFVPAVYFAPWPLKAAPLLITTGGLLDLLPIRQRWPKLLGRSAVAGGLVLLAQAMTMAIYSVATSRSHDLPWPLPQGLVGVARLLGIDAVADGAMIVMHSMRQVYRLAATWELLLDPPTVCFYVGGLVMFGLLAWSRLPEGTRWKAWIGALRLLTIVVLAWLPIRAGLLIALFQHRALRWNDVMPLHVMNQFWSPWVHLLMLLGPVLLAWRFVRVPTDEPSLSAEEEVELPAKEPRRWHYPTAVALVMLAVAVFTVAVHWDPVGRRKAGRVLVVERHSTWEPTDVPYDTEWFGHDSGYNYRAIYDYLSKFFNTSRLAESGKIDDPTLAKCDVLVIKTPTARYDKDEVDAVLRFVEQGGGLLLVGEHTNFEKSSSFLNDISRRLGFSFRHDLLFGVEDPYEQLYRAARVPHPILQHLPPMNFAISCSIDPGRSRGRAPMVGTGLWSLPPDYHPDNYFPFPQHHSEMRYGAFVQLWSMRHGKGRVLAFTDSTIFSNFCTFQDGKAELMLGMIDWLNRRSAMFDPRGWLLALGLLPLAAGLWLVPRRETAWLLLIAAGMCGWVLAGVAVAAVHRHAMPPVKPVRPMVRVVVDRTTSDVPLSKGAFVEDEEEGSGFGLLEQWIARLGYFTSRRRGLDAFSGDVLVVLCPDKSVSREFRENLVSWVEGGGKLFVLDSPENAASTANSLLWPFGLSVLRSQPWRGQLSLGEDWPNIPIELAYEVAGGEPVAAMGSRPVAAVKEFGKGRVMAVGFGSLFNDARMGFSWTAEPDDEIRLRFDALFSLLRLLVADEPIGPPPKHK